MDRRTRTVPVLVLGAALLAITLRTPDGSAGFYAATWGLAITWVLGAVWVGLYAPGQSDDWPADRRRTLAISAVTAVVVSASFLIGGYVAAQLPVLSEQVDELIGRTGQQGQWAVLVTAATAGVAEELFFRGALFTALRHPVVWTTVTYTLVTAATGNIGLILAAAVLGAMLAVARQISGSIVPAIAGHLAWSVTMIVVLPAVL